MDASGRGGPNKYSAQTTFGPVRKRTWGGRRRLMERRDGERVRRYSRGVQRERTTSRQRRRTCRQEVLLTGFQSALPCLPQVPVIWGNPSLKKCLLPSPRSSLRVGRVLLKKPYLSRQQWQALWKKYLRGEVSWREERELMALIWSEFVGEKKYSTTWRSGTTRSGQMSSSTRRTCLQDVLLMGWRSHLLWVSTMIWGQPPQSPLSPPPMKILRI